jgi:hypothetical protein
LSLLIAVLFGLLVGSSRAVIAKQPIEIPEIKQLWLVSVAFLPQFFAFFLRTTRELMPDNLASISLLGSQVLLLWFIWKNHKQPGFWLLGLGLGLNFLVIASNGGFMPISPNTVQLLIPDAPAGSWEIGSRFGTGKDIVLSINDMKFGWLSDRYLSPDWFINRVAFSVGDVLIALGTILFFGGMGAPGKNKTERMDHANVSNILAR